MPAEKIAYGIPPVPGKASKAPSKSTPLQQVVPGMIMVAPPSYHNMHMPPIWRSSYDASYPPYDHHIQSLQYGFPPSPNANHRSHNLPPRHMAEVYDYGSHGHRKSRAVPSSDDVSPPSSSFPPIAQWLEKLQGDHSIFPDGQNLVQYVLPLSQKGYFRLDDLLRACGNVGAQGLLEIDVGLSRGLSEKLYALLRADCKVIIRKFKASSH